MVPNDLCKNKEWDVVIGYHKVDSCSQSGIGFKRR